MHACSWKLWHGPASIIMPGFHPVGEGGGKGNFPSKVPSFPPPLPPKKEKRKEGKEEREALGAGRGREYESMRSRV